MSGSMVHLIAAKKLRPKGNALFYLGNIAPDAVVDWHDKDITHFRNLEDRQPSLISIAKNTAGDFAEGVLFHLYLDWKWDNTARQMFIDKTGDDWFVPYRHELMLACSYAFHNTDWAKQVWREMDLLDVRVYGQTPSASAMEVKEFVSRNNKWHNETVTLPSANFSPGLIEDFTTQIADEYVKWRLNNL